MARANTIQTNFTSGEVSPFIYGRVDVNKYFNGAKKLRNVIVKPQGGVVRRSGSRFIKEVKTSSKRTRLRHFVFSNIQAYVLEFGEYYIRVYRNGGVVESSPGVPVEIVTPYAEADLASLNFTQSADVLYIAHGSYQTRKLSRTSHTSWTLSTYAPTDGPYLDVDTTGRLLTIEQITDTATMIGNLSGQSIAIASAALFAAPDVNKYVEYVRFTDSSSNNHYSLLQITAYTSTTQVTVSVQDDNVIDSTGLVVTHSTGVVTVSAFPGQYTSGIFNSSSVGKRIRLNGSQAWYLVTSVINATQANVTAVSLVSYGGGTTVKLQNSFANTDVGKYVEYSEGQRWHLALITAYVSFDTVTVQVIDPILLYDEEVDVNFSANSGNIAITSTSSGVFKPGDVGKYVRAAESQVWAKITNYVNSSKVNGTVVSTFSYVFPTTRMNLRDNRVITVRLRSTENLFDFTDTGRHVRLKFGSQWRYVTITSVISLTQVEGTIDDFIPFDTNNANDAYNGGQADDFRMGAWSTITGWPAIIAFHNQRLTFAKTSTQPQTVWMSKTGAFEDMAPTDSEGTVLEDSSITVTVVSKEANPITWIETGPVLLVGTTGAEFQLKPASLSQALSPTNISALPQTSFGSNEPTTPHRTGTATLFIQRGGHKVREMVYDFNIDAFNSKDITIISEHILRKNSGAVDSAYQSQQASILWIVASNGKLIGATYERDQEVIAWHQHELGGSGVVESIACIPGSLNDEVWIVVRRTINGSTKRYIERFDPEFDTDAGYTKADAFFVDSGLSYSGSPATTISGLSHLEAATVQVLADGVYVGTKTVSGGAITLSNAASKVHVGFSAPATISTLEPEGGSQSGTSQGKIKRSSEITVRIKDSMPFKQGPDESNLMKLPSQHFGDIDTTNSVFSGDVSFAPEQPYDDAALVIYQDEPFPLIVNAIMPQLNTYE